MKNWTFYQVRYNSTKWAETICLWVNRLTRCYVQKHERTFLSVLMLKWMQTSKPPVSQGTAAFISPLTEKHSLSQHEKKGVFSDNCRFQGEKGSLGIFLALDEIHEIKYKHLILLKLCCSYVFFYMDKI